MVRSRSVLIFVTLSAASIAAAAPLRLASIVAEPASQEEASCALFGQDPPESGDPQDCGKSERNVSSGEHNVLDMLNSFPSSHDSPGIVSLPPFHSPSSPERVDADNTESVPSIEFLALDPSGPCNPTSSQEYTDPDNTVSSIESRAPYTSGPLEAVCRSIGVLSPGTPHAPDAHSLLQKCTDTEISSADGPSSPALRLSVPPQPASTFPASPLYDAASPNQRKDAREEEDTLITARISAGLSHPSPSVDYPLLRERSVSTDIASAHSIETRPPDRPPGPPVVNSDMMSPYYPFIAGLKASDQAQTAGVVRHHVRAKDIMSYEKATNDSTSWDEFVKTKSGQVWLEFDRLLANLHPSFDRLSVKILIMADIILAHLEPVSEVVALHVYDELREWNSGQYQKDTKASEDWEQFLLTETGRLCSKVLKRIDNERRYEYHLPLLNRRSLIGMISEDIRGLTVYDKATAKMNDIFKSRACTGGDGQASLRAACSDMGLFRILHSPCYQLYQAMVSKSPLEVALVLYDKMEKQLQEVRANGNWGRDKGATCPARSYPSRNHQQ
ncbi:hypothetical protein C8R42DRAFT_638479 [Lentinula raphanica]|nr:hypothetical protein C8R42DRAFT_638479 [Lentinula raphanica]